MSGPTVERTPSNENMSVTTESTNADTVTVGSMQGAGRERGTFMGMPIEELRKDHSKRSNRESVQDFVVLPSSSFFCKAPTMDELLCWSKVRICDLYLLTDVVQTETSDYSHR